MKLSKIAVVYTIPRTNEQKSTLDLVKKIIKKYKIENKLANRDELNKSQFKDKDLIIAAGGDGTFLRAAHFIDKQPIFGVNADVRNKEGFFMKSDKTDFEKKLNKIIKNEVNIKKLPRLEAYIDNKKAEVLALNEFFIGSKKSYHAAKYEIEIYGKTEVQKSSGVLVNTPAGSYAWAKACCGKTMPLSSNKFQFVVREPYEGRVFKNYTLKQGILNRNQEVRIISHMQDGAIVADSVSKEHDFKNGSAATVKLSNSYLNVIWFDK